MPTLGGTPVSLAGKFITSGALPDFQLVAADLKEIKLADLTGQALILNIFPSIDTKTCSLSSEKFHAQMAGFSNARLVLISKDLPFALGRYCGAQNLTNLSSLSAFRSADFGQKYGLEMIDGPLKGLLARAVIVCDARHQIVYTELVEEIRNEPNYDKAMQALAKAQL